MSPFRMWTPALTLGALLVSPIAFAQDEGSGPVALERDDAGDTVDLDQPAGGDDLGNREAEFDRELLTVEEEVNSLKERVFRSKATLQLLSEIVAQGSGTGARGSIVHVHELGRSYEVESLTYYLDGQSKFTRTGAEGDMKGVDELKVFEGALSPGTHKLSVNMRLRGSGGVFNYVDQISVQVPGEHTFEVEPGDDCRIKVTAEEKRGLSRSFTERPRFVFDVRCSQSMESEGAQ
ncbi:MAG: hypothetical protein H6742_11300 [Alphaproteobacteria bacterium]|nr:hypothetical protein [Alphaproteobacteria bacterium]